MNVISQRTHAVALSFAAGLLALTAISARAQDLCGTPEQVKLIAGRTMDAGTVFVGNDATYLYVVYTTSNGWVMTDTHLDISTSVSGIPQKNGNPIPGHFTYSQALNQQTYCMFAIPLSSLNLEPGTTVYIAAHADLLQLNGVHTVIQTQTGWGDGYSFPGKNWAMYFGFTIQACTM